MAFRDPFVVARVCSQTCALFYVWLVAMVAIYVFNITLHQTVDDGSRIDLDPELMHPGDDEGDPLDDQQFAVTLVPVLVSQIDLDPDPIHPGYDEKDLFGESDSSDDEGSSISSGASSAMPPPPGPVCRATTALAHVLRSKKCRPGPPGPPGPPGSPAPTMLHESDSSDDEGSSISSGASSAMPPPPSSANAVTVTCMQVTTMHAGQHSSITSSVLHGCTSADTAMDVSMDSTVCHVGAGQHTCITNSMLHGGTNAGTAMDVSMDSTVCHVGAGDHGLAMSSMSFANVSVRM